MGFSEKWCRWIKECVSFASTFVLVNGSPTEEFFLRRGLRQGDPLFPFLFLVMAEGMARLWRSMLLKGLFIEYSVGRNKIPVLLIQYDDDFVIISDGADRNWLAIKCVLRMLKLVVRLKVNFHKSNLISINISPHVLYRAAEYLNCDVANLPMNYLDVPIGINHRCLHAWRPLMDRLNIRLFA